MRQCRGVLQRCLGGALHASAALLAPSSRRATIEVDGEEYHPTQFGSRTTSRRRRRTPAELLADLDVAKGSSVTKTDAATRAAAAAAAAVNPVELLLRKHDERGRNGGGGGGDGGDGSSSSGGASGGGKGGSGGGGQGRAKRSPLTPPTKAASKSRVERDENSSAAAADAAAGASSSSLSLDAASDDYQRSLQVLTNPFRGLHSAVSRSYRIDQLLEVATPEDLLLARQERKSTAFSFLRFAAGEEFYKGHWESLPEVARHLDVAAGGAAAAAPLHAASKSSRTAPLVHGAPVPGLTLFNNDLGLDNPRVQCSYPLILAQRLLLFPDHLRHFHAISGRQDVPCDFFADIDLPGETAAGAEKALMEVLEYLEVRLPGIGFTDPFFLVLANAVPNKDKFSYHVHARSMTYLEERRVRGERSAAQTAKAQKGKPAKGKRGKKKATPAVNELDDEEDAAMKAANEEEEEDDYDDLSDMVNVVDNGTAGSASGSAKFIAFQDYRAVKLIGDEVNQTLGRDVIDTNCYRPNGMLRCAFSSKMASAQEHDFHAQQQQQQDKQAAARMRLVPLVTARDSALQQRLSAMEGVLRTMTDPEILEMTFCTRHMDHGAKVQKLVHEHAKQLVILDSHAPAGSAAHTKSMELLQATMKHRWKLIRPRHILGPQGAQAVEYDAYGNVVSPFLTEGAKWRRYKAVTAKLRKLPPRAAESYDVWVRVGLALHNFSNEDNCFEEWVLFSLKSPQKYSREVCRKKWVQFERNPDALNWRRGYNYLNSTVWRQV